MLEIGVAGESEPSGQFVGGFRRQDWLQRRRFPGNGLAPEAEAALGGDARDEVGCGLCAPAGALRVDKASKGRNEPKSRRMLRRSRATVGRQRTAVRRQMNSTELNDQLAGAGSLLVLMPSDSRRSRTSAFVIGLAPPKWSGMSWIPWLWGSARSERTVYVSSLGHERVGVLVMNKYAERAVQHPEKKKYIARLG